MDANYINELETDLKDMRANADACLAMAKTMGNDYASEVARGALLSEYERLCVDADRIRLEIDAALPQMWDGD